MGMIEFNNISIHYGDHIVFKNFDINIEKNEIITFFGPSGCGKSTLMKTVLGILKPEKGTLEINGVNGHEYTKKIAYVPQENQLLPWLTVEQNVSLWAEDSGTSKEQIEEVLKEIEMYPHKDLYPRELSGGMARRTALARGLTTSSQIMCLDEAIVAVERKMRRKLMVSLRKNIKKNKITTIIISHDFEEAIFMSDKIIMLTPNPCEIEKVVNINEILPEERNIEIFESPLFHICSKHLIP